MRAKAGAHLKAMRFEKDVVDLSAAVLAENKEAFEGIRESILEQVSELPLTVNVVAKEHDLIEAVLQEGWWSVPSEEKLDSLIARLAPLMRYRQRNTSPMVKLDLEDLVAIKTYIEYGPSHERLSTAAYREKVEARVRALVDKNPVLRKIADGKPIGNDELVMLAELLEQQDPYITEKLLQRIYDNKKAHFIQFLRHILGIEPLGTWTDEVSRAFDTFISQHTNLTQLQIQFLHTLRTFILQAGRFEKQDLVQAPFTQLHPQGIRGVFSPQQIDEVLDFAGPLVA